MGFETDWGLRSQSPSSRTSGFQPRRSSASTHSIDTGPSPLAFRTLWHGIRQPECVHDFDGSCSIALDWVSLDWVGLLWLAFDWIASDWLALGSIGLDCNWVLLGGWMAGRLASRVCSGVLGSGCLGGRVSEWLGA